MITGNPVFVNCTGDMTIVSFYSIFQTSAGFSCVRKVEVSIWAAQFVDYVFFSCDGILSLDCIRIDLRGVGSIEDEFLTGISKDSSKSLTETRNIGNRYEDIFLLSQYLDLQ